MGKTLVIMRVKAKDMERIDETIQELHRVKAGELKDAKKEEIGFGIQTIKAGFLVGEKDEQATDRLLEQVNALETVEEAEIVEMTLV